MNHRRQSPLLLLRALTAIALLTGCSGGDAKIGAYNVAPAVWISAPTPGEEVREGYIELDGSAEDEDGPFEEMSGTWSLKSAQATLEGCSLVTFADNEDGGLAYCRGFLTLNDGVEDQASGTVTLEVHDNSGGTGDASVEITMIYNEPPEVSLSAPNGQLYSDQPVLLTGWLSDDVGAPSELSLSWQDDGQPLNISATVADDGEVVATATLSEGMHTVELTATDEGEKTGSAEVTVTVGGPNSLPSCQITAPEDGAVGQAGDALLLRGTAEDADIASELLLVTWSADDTVLGESTPTSSGDVVLTGVELEAGQHVITLTAEDEVGGSCSDLIVYTIGAAPEITLKVPADGSTHTEEDAITFMASVSDEEDAPDELSISWSSSLDGEFSTQAADSAGSVQITTADLQVGYHTITAQATDTDGMSTSAQVTLTIEACMDQWFDDLDGDGFGDPDAVSTACSQPTGTTADSSDCDDSDADINPDAEELCNGVDDDCDGDTDADATDESTFYADGDGDGFGDASDSTEACETPSGHVVDDEDCDDTDADINPDADEICDEVDNDCDGDIDDDDDSLDTSTTTSWYSDADGDGYGDSAESTRACEQPSGYVSDSSDCDDANDEIHPDADEVCDEVDNDCDGDIDGDDSALSTDETWYADDDGDGFGDPDQTQAACEQPSGYVSDSSDCDDSDADINPDARETWYDGIDADCDDADDYDADGDGYRAESSGGSDCDDSDENVNPSEAEVCDDVDNDCSGDVDGDDAEDASTWYADRDDDGYGDSTDSQQACEQPDGFVSDATDCDDAESAANPGESEICDEIDNDCDGDVDDDDSSLTEVSVWYIDYDGDGYGSSSYSQIGCDQPTGYVDNDADCDDTDASLSPGEPEVCDEIDNDCDGDIDDDDDNLDDTDASSWYFDYDGDGYGTENFATVTACEQPENYADNADDCDDSESLVNPGKAEICSDGLDNNCDDSPGACVFDVENDLAYAEASLVGESTEDHAGYAVASAGDFNEDGYWDILIGAPDDDDGGSNAGAAYVVYGGITGQTDLSAADVKFTGEVSTDYAGRALASAGDVDGDGHLDVIIGAHSEDTGGSYAGAAYVVLGPVSSDMDLSAADAKLIGESASDYAGSSVASAGDVNDDGYDDLIIGAYGNDYGGTTAGVAYMVLGPVSGNASLSKANAALVGEASYDFAGSAVSSAGDLNGDGFSDVLVGAMLNDDGGTSAGKAYLMLGPMCGTLDLGSYADASLTGESGSDYAGYDVASAGDVNDDGYSDVLVGAYGDDDGGTDAGAGYLILGPFSGALDLGSHADAKLIGEASGDYAGCSISSAGDVDNDGYSDVLIGAYKADPNSVSDGGAAYLLLGPVTGSVDLSNADAMYYARKSSSQLGFDVSSAGDWNGDGLDDMMFSAPYNDDAHTEAGKVYIALGIGL